MGREGKVPPRCSPLGVVVCCGAFTLADVRENDEDMVEGGDHHDCRLSIRRPQRTISASMFRQPSTKVDLHLHQTSMLSRLDFAIEPPGTEYLA